MKKYIFLTLICLVAATKGQTQGLVISRSIDKVQPMTGLILWNDEAEDKKSTLGNCFALEYTYCAPCKVVTGKQNGKIMYDWTYIENILNAVKGRGHQAVLRFYYEYPGEKMGCNNIKGETAVPAYIKALSDYTETYKKVKGDGDCYYADWSNSELQWFVKQFMTDFAAIYDNDPRIAFLEVGFGHWAEYHIYGNSAKLGTNFPTKAYQKEFLLHMDTTFQILPWSISIDAASDEMTPIVDDNTLMALQFGLFDDSFMHEEHEISQGDGYNELSWNAIGKKTRWKTGVCGGEISYYSSSDQKNFLNPAGMYGVTWEQASAKYHITFMICNDAPEGNYATPARFKEGSMATGYRFRLTACSIHGNQTTVTFTNEGIAPIYKDAYPAVGTTRSTTSLKGLLPGESRVCVIPAMLTSANDLQILSDHILPTQQIQFNADVTTDLDEVTLSLLPSQKVMYDGQLLIFNHGHCYTTLGQSLKH